MLAHNDVEQVLRALCQRLGQPMARVRKAWQLDPFTFALNFLPATASAITTARFTVQNDSAFAIVKTAYIATDTSDAAVSGLQPFGSGALTSLGPFLVTLTDSGSGRSLSDVGIPIDSWFGVGMRPYLWTVPKLLDPNSTLEAGVQNLSATDRRVRLAFHGYKVFGDLKAFQGI
jgi:hypothetical protein